MNRPRLAWLLLLTGLFPPPAPAQTLRLPDDGKAENRSHIPIPLPSGFGSPEDVLTQRLRRLRGNSEVEKLAQMLAKNPELMNKLLREVERERQNGNPDFDNHRIRELFEKHKHELPGGEKQQLSDEGIDAFRQMLERAKEQDPKNLKLEELTPPSTKTPDPAPLNGKAADGASPGTNPSDSGGPRGDATPLGESEPPVSGELARRLFEAASKVQDWDTPLADSQALRRALHDFNRFDLGGRTERFGSQFPEWGRALRLDRFRPEGGWSLGGNIKMPSVPNVSWSGPRLPSWRPSGGGWSLSAPPAPSGGGDFFKVFLWAGVVGLLGFLLWRVLRAPKLAAPWRRIVRAGAGLRRFNPAAVRTREELIAAFEGLALLRLGQPATHCNHLEIAHRLGGDDPRLRDYKRQLAHRLAGVYETARYAPPDDPLPDHQIAAARHDLCLLAGVPAS